MFLTTIAIMWLFFLNLDVKYKCYKHFVESSKRVKKKQILIYSTDFLKTYLPSRTSIKPIVKQVSIRRIARLHNGVN